MTANLSSRAGRALRARSWLGSSCGAVAVTLLGCASMHATYLGNPKEGQRVDGIPIVVQRPRYLKVTERDVKYLLIATATAQSRSGARDGADLPAHDPNETPASPSALHLEQLGDYSRHVVEFEMLSVGEVYALDFRRPAAGTGEFSLEYDQSAQYPKKVTGKVDDQSIKQLGDSLTSLIEKAVKGFTPTSGELSEALAKLGVAATVVEAESTVTSIRIYDLDRLGDKEYRPIQIYPLPPEGNSGKTPIAE